MYGSLAVERALVVDARGLVKSFKGSVFGGEFSCTRHLAAGS
jgi:hypothetical protein